MLRHRWRNRLDGTDGTVPCYFVLHRYLSKIEREKQPYFLTTVQEKLVKSVSERNVQIENFLSDKISSSFNLNPRFLN